MKHSTWRQLFFKKKQAEQIWRNAVVYLLRDNYAQINPGGLPGLAHIRNEDRRYHYLIIFAYQYTFPSVIRGCYTLMFIVSRSEKTRSRYLTIKKSGYTSG
ncbi:hypothetical protein Q5N27_24215 [Serratia ureilytica]|uniref:Type II toxin-antitoxin system RelE/ParE family toxin n=1 Tax=Serratia ureilytica TaxID=300181 RepID=A0ABU0VQX4_9GAMM|nr:hypothetical protein [Serratia ureilytica]MDQ1811337.1 hypothetical protein [Serratia ureilytica]MDQ1840398.1 hypothetical protein [Serratia ureilytica]MDQ1863842.1 hypothetical protein [Serratia ureilytica]